MLSAAAKQPSRIQAWLVHTYTGLGAVLAFVAAWAVVHGDDRLALGALFVATLVDGTDGILARAARVKEVLPEVDGARIDDIVDYMTFVLVPMLLLEAAGGLYLVHAFPVIAIVMLSSMYGFVAPDAKSSDHFFTGFPSYWNIVVLYLLLFQVSRYQRDRAADLQRARIRPDRLCLPTRTPTLRALTLVLGSCGHC